MLSVGSIYRLIRKDLKMLKKTLCVLCVLGFVSACSTTAVEQEVTAPDSGENDLLFAEQETVNVVSKDKTVVELVEEYRVEKQARLDEEIAEFKQNSFDKAVNKFTKNKQSEIDDEIDAFRQQKLDEFEEAVNQYRNEQLEKFNGEIEGFKAQKATEFENAVEAYKKEQLGLLE